jgi:hypothetical protein
VIMLFKKNEPMQPSEEHEAATLRNEMREIVKEENALYGQAIAEKYNPAKEKIIERQGVVFKRKIEIQSRLEQIKESQALPKAADLVRNTRNDIVLKINDERQRIPESLLVELRFTCGHTLKVEAHKLFLLQTNIKSNTHLLEFWKTTLTNHENHQKLLVCERCQRKRKAYIAKNHTVPNTRSGTARLIMQVI